MKEKILAAIKAKFPKVNLSKKRLDEISAKIEKKVIDDETKIDAALDEFNDFNPLSEIAKVDDTIRNLEAKVKQPAPAKKDENTPPEETKSDVPDDTPPYIKALMESNKLIQEKLAALEGEKTAGTIKGKAESLLKEIPVSYWGKRALPVKLEDVETFVEEVKTDYTDFKNQMTDQGLSVLSTPKNSTETAGGGTDKKANDKEVSAIVENIM